MQKQFEIPAVLANTLWHTARDHGERGFYPVGYLPIEGMLDPCDPIFEGGFDMWCSSMAHAVLLWAAEVAGGWVATVAWQSADIDDLEEEVLVVTNNPSRRLDRRAAAVPVVLEA